MGEVLLTSRTAHTAASPAASARMAPQGVKIVHAIVPGRARLRVPGLHRSESFKQRVEAQLATYPHVLSVNANPLTGTVLVLFHRNCGASEIAAAIDAWLVSGQVAAQSATPQRPFSAAPARRKSARALAKSPPAAPAVRTWHRLAADQALAEFDSDPLLGLSTQEAGLRLARYGPNSLPRAAPRSALSIFIGQFKSLPVILLGVSAVLSVATGGLADAVVILGVVLINAGIGYVTESQAERTINALTSVAQPPAAVVREGGMRQIAFEDVVPGDLLLLTPGCIIAADARLIIAKSLSVDESSLTGESLPVTKTIEALAGEDIPLADRGNMVYHGTIVTGGSGLAVVVAPGRGTELGTIQALVGETRPPETPMQRQLDRLGNQMVWMSVAVCGLVFAVGLLRGYGLLQMLKTSISLAVAAVPEGLPTVATTTLALGIRRMRRHHVLIRHLDAVETLGAVQVICLDKTGTLTLNRMSVLALHSGGMRLHVADGMFTGAEGRVNPYEHDEMLRLMHVAVLCNESQVDAAVPGHFVLNGSATENALVQMAIAAGVTVSELRAHYPIAKTEYRAEGHAYMATWHQASDGRWLTAVKGSPEQVLALCRWQLAGGKRRALTDAAREEILNENERMAGEALRVLGFAFVEKKSAAPTDAEPHDLIWLGLIGMADPVRPGTGHLIEQFHTAGIKTVMITGDQSATAYAIGKELALSGTRQLEILDSTHLERLDPAVLSALAQTVEIFSRVSPAHKLQIVQGLQRAGKVVAMTGDGINAGPALKAADIGVAMGDAGTEVARMVADVVLEDDNLQTMIIAVSEGRTIYNNIRKSIHFLMSTNLSEIMVMLTSVAGGMGQPLNTMQLLWINLITDIFPALALAVEPPEPDVLSRPPRDPDEPVIGRADLKRYGFESLTISAGALGAYGYGLLKYGQGPQANTLAFMALTLAQLEHAISCRSDTHGLFSREKLPPNRYLQAAIAGSVVLQASTVLLPPLRGFLGTTPLTLLDTGVVLAGSSLPFLVNEATKTIGRDRAATTPTLPRSTLLET